MSGGPSWRLVAGPRSGLGLGLAFVMCPAVTLSSRSRGGIASVKGCCGVGLMRYEW